RPKGAGGRRPHGRAAPGHDEWDAEPGRSGHQGRRAHRFQRTPGESQMTRALPRSVIALAWLLWATAAAQEVRTQAPCSPVIDRTQGSVSITFSGGCTVGIMPAELASII